MLLIHCRLPLNCSWTTEGTIASCNSAMVSFIWIRFWTNLRVTWNFSFTPAPQKIKKIAWKWKLKLNDLKIDHSCCDIWERKIILKMCLNVSRISSGFTHKKVGWIFGNTEWRKKSKATKKETKECNQKSSSCWAKRMAESFSWEKISPLRNPTWILFLTLNDWFGFRIWPRIYA